jgi:hypothetical protein
MAKKVGEKGLIFVTAFLIILGFFSSTMTYTGQYHSTTAETELGVGDHRFNCRDIRTFQSQQDAGELSLTFDIDSDGDIDNNDWNELIRQARSRPCPLSDECTSDYCGRGDIVVKCGPHPLGLWRDSIGGGREPLRVIQPEQCPAGQTCTATRGTVGCGYPFRG